MIDRKSEDELLLGSQAGLVNLTKDSSFT